ncbi:hypothetical protein [Pandoraea sp. PE-S2R-1]|uniref:hypothetical protein n=1 Tax=Pandoraea sp. PE-S2R-1 TaxID=1986994 RepID=UPI00201620C5|nr:hypothetical protein [Pandoraea sp. PE-S2R-1]
MTKHVGFCGGSSIRELGSALEVAGFFEVIEIYVTQQHPSDDWSILTDRLYKRYIRLEELNYSSNLMSKVQISLSKTSISNLRKTFTFRYLENSIDIDQPLSEFFSNYFSSFNYCTESAILFHKSWGIYKPVRTVFSDIPDFYFEKNRNLSEYDSLTGEPFWLR